jgi:hypothetical protein
MNKSWILFTIVMCNLSIAIAFNVTVWLGYTFVKKEDLKPKVVEVCTSQEAMTWWTGSSDLNVHREALCFNVTNPSCKKVRK